MLMSWAMFTLVKVLLLTLVSTEITLNIYDNTVLDGKPAKIVPLQSLNYSFSSFAPFSAQILGTLKWDNSTNIYYFQCNFDSDLFGFVWIDDHLICAPNIYNQYLFSSWNLSFTYSAFSSRQSFIRIDLYSSNSNNNNNNNNDLDFSLLWPWLFNL